MSYRVLPLEEAARYLHIAAADLQSLVKDREIPFEKQGDRLIFRKRELDAWASQRILGLRDKGLTAYHRASSVRAHDLSAAHAIMPELMTTGFIDPALRSRTKSSVLRDMVALAEKTERLMDPKDLLESLLEREKLCSTAMNGGIALLHPRHHDPYMFADSFVAFARAIQAIPFGAPDGTPSDLFFLICTQDDRIHLHILARLCCMCHQTDLLHTLRAADDAGAMLAAILHAEEQAIKML